MAAGGSLGPALARLADELADLYLSGDLVLVAGAGVSRASGLPGWLEMVSAIQSKASVDLNARFPQGDIDVVLDALHGSDAIGRADSLKRLLGSAVFHARLHEALYGGLPAGEEYRPAVAHWHIAALTDRNLMPDVFTSNYDDLLEDAKRSLGRSGRVRHFHGRLPQGWTSTRLGDPPVVTSRDYMAAEEARRYERLAGALRNKTALLVGFSLSDPNLARLIRSQARDCRAIVGASPGDLSTGQQRIRLNLLRRYWRSLNITVTALEAHEDLPAFLFALRRRIMAKQGGSMQARGEQALGAIALANPRTWTGAEQWRAALRAAVTAAKDIATGVEGDRSLRAGFFAIKATGFLEHMVGSNTTKVAFEAWPRRTLDANPARPWGAAGYTYAAGVPVVSSATGPAFDRNVPDPELLVWQSQRAAQGRLPAASVLCVPAWVRYGRSLISVGVLYFSSQRPAAFDDLMDAEELRSVLQLTLEAMIKPENAVEGGVR